MNIVKLGGSVVTNKGAGKRIRRDALRRLAREAALPETIVLHGAGSFGHDLAKKANLRQGLQSPAQVRAAAQVAADVRTLHLAVLDALLAAGARPWSLPPGQVAQASGGELASLDTRAFREAMRLGFTPVSCGDVVLDDKQGVAIVSADAIALELAKALDGRRVVFATDVDGIYTVPPGTKGAKLLPRLTPEQLRGLDLGGSTKTDVTGGMAGKARAIAAIAEAGAEVWVVNGNKAGRLRGALKGKPSLGTRVSREG